VEIREFFLILKNCEKGGVGIKMYWVEIREFFLVFFLKNCEQRGVGIKMSWVEKK